jgi:SAM-dependent methyltransferase
MDKQDSELLDKIRQQFDFGPYPRIPLEASPKKLPGLLYTHNLVTPYYLRNQSVIDPAGKIILDAGCGTGHTSLVLAEANPGAKIVGIDISEKSIELARQRLAYHNIENSEFYSIPLDKLPRLGFEFDYINCDELLYLFPNSADALAAMKSVLKPDGIIRSNLHSSLQRFAYFRAQQSFEFMGLMEENPQDMEIDIVIEFMKALEDWVDLKQRTWRPDYEKEYENDKNPEGILMNYLFQGDKGYTIPDLFMALKEAELEFVNMVNWRQWNIMELFKDPDNLPIFLAVSLPETTIEERLHLFELLHPVHRLLDFWCGHPGQSQPFLPIAEWTDADWRNCTVHLHPQLVTPQVKEELSRCLKGNQVFPISQLLPIAGGSPVGADVTVAACLFPPLLESPQPISALLQRWKQLKPLNLETFEPLTDDEALASLKDTLTGFEDFGYLLLERAA